ncbi:D-glycero-beta-D-manno-heptose-7-phosphate kinase [Thauera sinica]|uniref:D-glycero-beta-D-manno-heptose-7-phosphate kinase n=1 Tax=Thauera sinica TaxID=2665146 RepID=A0ABW1APY5_9RHOO|nr:D-glycero-beta-D-manno-heptose-7-phosphate kinase [Thauera sp. K11]
MLLPLPDFSGSRVLVAGDVMLDRYWHGATSRISPEAPVPVVRVGEDEVRAGGAGNVALNAIALGARTAVAGLVGEDEAGRLLAARLQARGVRCRLQAVSDAPTITKLRVISRHQQLIRLDFEQTFAAQHAGLMEAAVGELVADADVLILSDYAKGTLADVQALISLARAQGVPVVVDPKGADFDRYRGATVVKPNLAEFEAVVGPCADDATLIARGEALRAGLELEALLVTRGERGMTLLRRGAAPFQLPTRAREVFDVTGAGDTVSAALGCGIAAGLSLADATVLANLAAGIVVGKLGTATATVDELRAEMERHAPLQQGMVAADAIAAVCERARAAGETVVAALAPGGMDAAALAFLAAARTLGDRLLVIAPSADGGAPHAQIPLLAALRAVDWVVPAAAADIDALVDAVSPDAFACRAGQPAGIAEATLARLAAVHAIPAARGGAGRA